MDKKWRLQGKTPKWNKTKLQTTELLKQWSEQTTQKLPNKGSQTVLNTYKITHKLNGTENCEISENSVEIILLTARAKLR